MPSAGPESEDFLAGQHSSYQYVRGLSSGTFGTVLLYQHAVTNELVAIKFIKRGKNAAMSKYVELEVLNHRWLKHPHVVKFKELFLTPRHICIVMEYANGGNLYNKVLHAGRLDEHEARWYFQQLVIALDYCHRPGVVKPAIFNRDIKLENILLESYQARLPMVKICDFGYSKNGFVSSPKSKVGTLACMAPEVLRGGKYDGEKADTWSCGVTLYVMLVGRYPFTSGKERGTAEHTQEMISRIEKGDWKPWELASHISPACRDLLSHLLAVDPGTRYRMADVYGHPWFLTNLPQAALHINTKCLTIEDYSDVQSEADIRAMLKQAQDASDQFDDLIDAAIGEDLDDPYGFTRT